MTDIRQSQLWMNYWQKKGYKTLKINSEKKGVLYGTLHPLLLGFNLLKIQRGCNDPDWDDLRIKKRKNKVLSTIIEPWTNVNQDRYKEHGYKLSNFPYLATKTIIVNLGKSKEILWRGLSENTKRLIKKNAGLEIRNVKPSVFLKYWKKNSKIWVLGLGDLETMRSVLGKKVLFLLGYIDGVAQSGLLIVETEDTANYLHSFTTTSGRQSGAHFKLVWECMLKEKSKGILFFDFEGIYDSRWPQKRWLGFSEFKKKFGGKEVSFPGCFHKWF